MRITPADTINLLGLTRRQILLRIETPPPGEKALPAQDLVDSGNAACEVVARVEKSGIGVGYIRGYDQQPMCAARTGTASFPYLLE